MIRLGLTGSIGMGKSATAAMFEARGVPVFDADKAVHVAYAPNGEAVAPIEWAFPGVITKEGGIDRKRLRERVLNNPDARKRLEGITHPIVAASRASFLKAAKDAAVVVFDVPLLFETGGERALHAVAVVSAPAEIQKRRVLARPGMTEADFEAILALQMPDSEKRRRADFVINTGYGFAYAEAQVEALLAALREPLPGTGKPDECAKSSSTPRPLVSAPPRATALSR
jgi:dephospho-CoA kinase